MKFNTKRGSIYTSVGLRTQRNKAQCFSHGNDYGVKEVSEVTVYISEKASQRVVQHISLSAEFSPTFFLTDEFLFLLKKVEEKWEVEKVKIKFSFTPEIGLTPIEFWGLKKNQQGYCPTKYHVGNTIIQLNPAS